VPAALVVERDAVLRNIIRSVLTAQGFEIVDAANVAEAQSLIDLLLNPPVDLVILGHPCADGADPLQSINFVERLLSLAPTIKVLVISECPYQVVVEENGMPKDGSFLQGPFTAAQFINTVRSILDPQVQ
jgi:DNA-binding NarL/FixJ family response regulator